MLDRAVARIGCQMQPFKAQSSQWEGIVKAKESNVLVLLIDCNRNSSVLDYQAVI